MTSTATPPAAAAAAAPAAAANAKAAFPAFPAARKKALVVFVHGFLGSEDSFASFPQDLAEALAAATVDQPSLPSLPVGSVDVVAFPRYDTKGNNQRLVQSFMNWLLLHGSSARYEAVILCAHSMGGLLVADAYRYLYKLTLKDLSNSVSNSSGSIAKTPLQANLSGDDADAHAADAAEDAATAKMLDAAQQPSWLSRARSAVGSWFSYSNTSPDAAHPDDVRFLINIRGIITFDSPFFGLHPNVITKTGTAKAQNIVTKLPETLPQYIPTAEQAVNKLIPDRVAMPTGIKHVHVPVSTVWVKEAAKSVLSKSTTPSTTAGTAAASTASAASSTTAPPFVPPPAPSAASGSGPASAPMPGSAAGPSNPAASASAPGSTSGSAAQPDAPAAGSTSSFPSWSKHAAATTAVVAVAALTTMSSGGVLVPAAMVAQSIAAKWAINQADELYKHAEFLNPLLSSRSAMMERVTILQREMEHMKRLYFRGFYLDLVDGRSPWNRPLGGPANVEAVLFEMDDIDADADATADATAATGTPAQGPEASTSTPPPASTATHHTRHFCIPPPPEVSDLFDTVASPLSDQIDAHMNMFVRDAQGEERYAWFVSLVVKEVLMVLSQ